MTVSSTAPRVAVLYQAIQPPVVNGVRKPMKPGGIVLEGDLEVRINWTDDTPGYRDSCADIAYCLSKTIHVITSAPVPDVNTAQDTDWCFPDTEEGILSAIQKGATHLWANTILFASHPLQTSVEIGKIADSVKMVGQPPCMVDQFDDKEVVNDMLRAAAAQGSQLTMPSSWTLTASESAEALRSHVDSLSLPYPVVGKPIRGRGSHGVKVCASLDELVEHAKALFQESPRIMVEEYLAGEEGTVTVMPAPSNATGKENGQRRTGYWSLPVVTRFNHHNGIAPYNGTVAVTANSRAIGDKESSSDPAYARVQRECEVAAELLQPTTPIRIDVRRRRKEVQGDGINEFVLFDVNVKPNLTGPGRPGREDQACLTLMAAESLGWDYSKLLTETLKTARPLSEVRAQRPATI